MSGGAEALVRHWTPLHAAANAVAIIAFATLIARRESMRSVCAVLCAAGLLQLATLRLFLDGIEYRGASGFACALAAHALAGSLRLRENRLAAAALALASFAYVAAGAFGLVVSPVLPPGVASAWPMHLAGIAAGVVTGLATRFRERRTIGAKP